jgi:hypothetical protein
MGFVSRNTHSLTDQVKSAFWLVWLAHQGLRAIGTGSNFGTDRLLVLVIKISSILTFGAILCLNNSQGRQCFVKYIVFVTFLIHAEVWLHRRAAKRKQNIVLVRPLL